MEALLRWLAGLGDWIYVILAVLTFLETSAFVGLVAPGETAVIFAGFLAGQGYLSPSAVVASASLGAILGDSVGYELGRRFGPALLRRHRFRRRALVRAEEVFARHGGKAVFFGRFVGFLRAFAPVLAGIARMPYPRFVLFNVTGAVLWAAACTTLGYAAGTNWRLIERWLDWIGAAAAAVLVGVILVRWRAGRQGRRTAWRRPRARKRTT
jgi:membrane-associated protein